LPLSALLPKRDAMRIFSVAISAALLLLVQVPQAQAQWKAHVGWDQLFAEYGGSLTNGTGIAVGMAEAPEGANYMPDLANPEFIGKTITPGSGASGTSGHANYVAQFFYGNTVSIAPGVTNVTMFDANDWLINKLGFGSGADPVAHPYKVMNNSWVGDATDAQITNLSQRADFVARQNQMTIVAGTNNGNTNPLPRLLSHSYNTIIVGLSNGDHAFGSTSTYGLPRNRPDIVAPGRFLDTETPFTSVATAMVSSAAAMLHQRAGVTNASRSDTMRAIILAGATKQEFPGWSRTDIRPLDTVYGAGELNVYNSYKIIEGGSFAGSFLQTGPAVGNRGWDYRDSVTAATPVYYEFSVANGTTWDDLSIILTWDMQITDTNASAGIFTASELLGDLNLDFFNANGSSLGNLIDSSLATGGNIEHLYFTSLAEGNYRLRVSSNLTRDFAIAWRGNITAIPEPGSIAILAFGVCALFCRRTRRHQA